jgi:hypothetical protein
MPDRFDLPLGRGPSRGISESEASCQFAMDLAPNGIDIFYIDESERHPLSVASCVKIPFLRPKAADGWEFVWERYEAAATKWRRDLSKNHSIRFREELHGYPILGRKGQYHRTWRNLTHEEATTLYKDALATLTWLPDKSIMSTFATDKSELMGHKGIFAGLFGLFQRMRNQCGENVNGLAFFDEGHKSYIRLYRMAQKYLPTGSKFGAWDGGRLTRNLPLTMFPKDGNTKCSDLSYFIQIADLVSYSVRLKLEHERGHLSAKRTVRNHHTLYDSIPRAKLNVAATMKRRDAIVPT